MLFSSTRDKHFVCVREHLGVRTRVKRLVIRLTLIFGLQSVEFQDTFKNPFSRVSRKILRRLRLNQEISLSCSTRFGKIIKYYIHFRYLRFAFCLCLPSGRNSTRITLAP